jgi:perosamine synthetase
MRAHFLPFHIPDIGEEEIQSVVETLRSGWITTGPKVKQFEEDFKHVIGAKNAVAVNSGTAALHLALEAVGIRENDEVIVPTMTFASTAEAVLYLKAKPVLVDCSPDSLNIDPYQVDRAITDKTKAIIPVHFGGLPCEMDQILEMVRTHQLKVIEDAAHALPSRYKQRMIGTIGDVTCFSFYATKTLATGEGGMITTACDDYAERIGLLRLHGFSKDSWTRSNTRDPWSYEIMHLGYKYNMTDIAAALGIEQLEKCFPFWKRRQWIAERYTEGFDEFSELTTPSVTHGNQHSWHLYVIQLELDRLRISRNEFIEVLRQAKIGTGVHFMPLHLHRYYRETFGYRPMDFPNATALFQRILSLPVYPKMTDSDVQDVIATVTRVVEAYRR